MVGYGYGCCDYCFVYVDVVDGYVLGFVVGLGVIEIDVLLVVMVD